VIFGIEVSNFSIVLKCKYPAMEEKVFNISIFQLHTPPFEFRTHSPEYDENNNKHTPRIAKI